jgi:hypothetical protein
MVAAEAAAARDKAIKAVRIMTDGRGETWKGAMRWMRRYSLACIPFYLHILKVLISIRNAVFHAQERQSKRHESNAMIEKVAWIGRFWLQNQTGGSGAAGLHL